MKRGNAQGDRQAGRGNAQGDGKKEVRDKAHGVGTNANTPRGAGSEHSARKDKRRVAAAAPPAVCPPATFFFVAAEPPQKRLRRSSAVPSAAKKKVASVCRRSTLPTLNRLLPFLPPHSTPAPLGVFASVPPPCTITLTTFFPPPCTVPPACLPPSLHCCPFAYHPAACCRAPCAAVCCRALPCAAYLRRPPPPPISAAHLCRPSPPPISAADILTPPLRFGRAQQGGTPQRSPSIRRPCPPPSLRHQPLSPSLRRLPPPPSVTLRADLARRHAAAQPVKLPTIAAEVLPFEYEKNPPPSITDQGGKRLQKTNKHKTVTRSLR